MAVDRTPIQAPVQAPTRAVGQAQSAVNFRPAPVQDPTTKPGFGVLNSLLRAGQQLSAAALQKQQARAYADGAAQYAAGVSEEDIQADPFMGNIAMKGYKNSAYRSAQARYSVEVQEFIEGAGKNMPPEDMSKWMQKKRADVFKEMTDGMSEQDYLRATQSQVALDQQLLQAHNKAFKNQGTINMANQYSAQGADIIASLSKTRGSGPNTEHDVAMSRLHAMTDDLLTDSFANPAMGQQVAANLMLSVAATPGGYSDVQAIVDSGKLDNLPLEIQSKISAAIAKGRNNELSNNQWKQAEFNTKFEAEIVAGNKTWDEFNEQAAVWHTQGYSANFIQSMSDKMIRSVKAQDTMAAAIGGYTTGSHTELAASGYSQDAAAAQLNASMAKEGHTQPVRMATMISNDIRFGNITKTTKDMVNGTLNEFKGAVASGQPISKEATDSLDVLMQQANMLETSKVGGSSVLTASMDDENAGLFMSIVQGMRQGVSPHESLEKFNAQQQAVRDETAVEKYQVSQKITTMIRQREGHGTGWFRGKGSDDFDSLRGLDVSDYTADVATTQVLKEFKRLAMSENYRGFTATEEGQDRLLELANAKVASRVIALPTSVESDSLTATEFGVTGGIAYKQGEEALVLDDRYTFADVFGKDVGDGPEVRERIGVELLKQFPPAYPGGRSTFMQAHDGNVYNVQISEDGYTQVDRSQPVDTRAIGQKLIDERTGRDKAFATAVKGKTLSVHDHGGSGKVKFTVDGNNVSGINREVALTIREGLLDHEGYSTKTYLDSEGKLTGGIGHLMTAAEAKKYPEGTEVPQAQIQQWWKEDTEKAMRLAQRALKEEGIADNGVMRAYTYAYYQLGQAGFDKFKEGTRARLVAGKGKPEAFKDFQTKLRANRWYSQTPERVLEFEKQVMPFFGINTDADREKYTLGN